jgi:hypothetical protein
MNEEIVRWRVNDHLLERFLEIKKNELKPVKRGFAKWLKYIYSYKA